MGGQVYYIPGVKPKEQLLIRFCNRKKCLVFQNDKELVIHQMPLKGISVESLMGNLEQLARFPDLQLELPLDWEALKINTTFSDST